VDGGISISSKAGILVGARRSQFPVLLSPARIANHSKLARAKPIEVDPRAPYEGDDHDWIFGIPGVDVARQESQLAMLPAIGILGESWKRTRELS
jgi:hypothetical protein